MSETLEPQPLLEPATSPRRGILVDEHVRPVPTEAGDHDRFAHYAPRDKIMEAMVTGTPIMALCGKVWVPSRDPNRFPVCPACKEIFESLPPGDDGSGPGSSGPGSSPE
jgi:Protein of unknown function (DUF3039)